MIGGDPKKSKIIFQKSMRGRQVILRVHRKRDEPPLLILIISISIGSHPDAIVLCPINISGIYLSQNRVLPDTILSCIISVNSIPGANPQFRRRDLGYRFNIVSDELWMTFKDILQFSALHLQQGSKCADPDGLPAILNDT